MKPGNRLIFGVGINDADYTTQKTVNGSVVKCPFYSRWSNMIDRCYSKKTHAKHPTYSDCEVDKRWLSFMAFRSWMIRQAWEGMQLDKDLLIQGNKIYSPESCVFISSQLNSILNDCGSLRGEWPQGVTHFKRDNKFKSTISIEGRPVHLGLFETPEEAEKEYLKHKHEEIIRQAMLPETPVNVRDALIKNYQIKANSHV